MKVYFVRHGESDANILNVCQGPDSQLTELGRKQAERVGHRLAKMPVDLIVSSSYDRAKETAEIINREFNKPIIYSDLLIERKHASEVVNRPYTDPEVMKISEIVLENYHTPGWRYGDGENFEDLKARALKSLAFIEGQQADHLLVVTHGLFLRILLATMIFEEGLTSRASLKFKHFFRTYNAGITICDFDKTRANKHVGGWEITAWNDHSHLK